MNRIGQRVLPAIAIVVALVALPHGFAAAGQEREGWIDVLSVKLEENGEINVDCREIGTVMFENGTFQADGEIEVVFRSDRLVSVREPEAFVDSFFLADDGSVMMKVEKGEKPLPDAQYRLRGTPRRGKQEQRRAIGFRVNGGKIVSVQVESY